VKMGWPTSKVTVEFEALIRAVSKSGRAVLKSKSTTFGTPCPVRFMDTPSAVMSAK